MSDRRRSRRNFTAVVLGQAVGQLSVLLVVPVLTRAYDPAALGGYQVAMALATTLQPLASLRVEFVIPSSQHDATAHTLRNRAVLSSTIATAVAVAVAVAVWLAGAQASAHTVAMTAILLIALVWTVVDNAILVRIGAERRLALRNALAGLLTAGLQLLVATLEIDPLYLAVAVLLARGFAILVTRGRSARIDRGAAGQEPREYGWKRTAMSVSSGMTASATSQVFTVASGPLYGAAASGYVGVSQRIAGAPITLLGQGLGQALQTRNSRLIRSNSPGLMSQMRKQMLLLGGIALLTSVTLITLAPLLAVPILGDGWEPAGVVTAILAVPISFQLVIGPLMPVLPMLGRESLLLSIQLVRLALVAASIAWAFLANLTLYAAAGAVGLATVIGYIGMLWVVIVEVRKFDHSAGTA